MINLSTLATIRQLISEGETGRAIETLIQQLESETNHAETLRTLRVVQANFHDVKRKENKGLLPYSEVRVEYARVNDALLGILEELLSGKAYSASRQAKWPAGRLLIAGVLILLFTGAIWWVTDQRYSAPGIQCPEFKPESKRVLVLAFQRLSGENSSPELAIQTRISDLAEKNNLITDVRLISDAISKTYKPGNAHDAAELGRKCQADLVIWGDYEKFQDSISVDIRYAFTEENWPPGIAATTFKNVSELKFDRMKISHFDEAVLRLCTALALHENRMDLAKKWLLKQPNPNQREIGWLRQIKASGQ